MKKSFWAWLGVIAVMAAAAFSTPTWAQPDPPDKSGMMTLKTYDMAATTALLATSAQPRPAAQNSVTQRGAFALYSAYDDGSCDAKPAPMKPGKAPGKGGGKKKCISASVPLDDGYTLVGKKGKKAKKPKPTA